MAPMYFENKALRTALVVIILLMFGLQIWFQYLNRESFSALASANLLLVQKVEKFETEVKQFRSDNDDRFDKFNRDTDEMNAKRKATLDGWLDYASRTKIEVGQIHDALDALTVRLEELSQKILDDVDSAKRNTAVTRRQAVAAQETLSQKIVTKPEADALKRTADKLQRQNKELRKKKSWKLF